MLCEFDDVIVAATPLAFVNVTTPAVGKSSVSAPAFHTPSATFSPPVNVTCDPLPENCTVPAPDFVSALVPFCEMMEFDSDNAFPAATKTSPFVRSWKLILFADTDAGASAVRLMSGPMFAAFTLAP